VNVVLSQGNRQVKLENVLIDTGSASSVFSADKVLEIGLKLEQDDVIHRIRGVGGTEFVFTKQVDRVAVGQLEVKTFEIEVGAMAYGFEIEGIIGLDFLMEVGAVIDLEKMKVYSSLERL
jgi:predicted aspartyl protease